MHRVKMPSEKKYKCVVFNDAEHELYKHHFDAEGFIVSEELLMNAYSKQEFEMKLAVLGIKEEDIHFM